MGNVRQSGQRQISLWAKAYAVAAARLAPDAALAELRKNGWEPDYVEVRRRGDLAPPGEGDRERVVLGAARLGGTRLIDAVEF